MKRNEQGFSHVLVFLLVVVVLGGVGYAGYRVMQANKKDAKPTATTSTKSTSASTEVATQNWKEAGSAVDGTYADADIVQIGDSQWRLYYAIQPEVKNNQLEVYSSVSTDGKNWTKEEGMRKTMATFPDVVKLSDGRYRMYYQNAGAIKSATSSDGLTFKDETGTRIDTANEEGLTLDNVAAPTVLQMKDGTFVMVYRGSINERYAQNTPNPSTNVLMWATSPDGLTWAKKGIAVDSRNSTLAGQLDGPDLVVWEDGSYKLFSTSYTGVYEFSFDGQKFGEPVLAFAGDAKKQGDQFMGAPPGDPTVAEIDSVWYMYYGGGPDDPGIMFATYQ